MNSHLVADLFCIAALIPFAIAWVILPVGVGLCFVSPALLGYAEHRYHPENKPDGTRGATVDPDGSSAQVKPVVAQRTPRRAS